MNFVLINPDPSFGKEPIQRGEAINLLIERGIVPNRAETLINNLPCGVGLTFYVNGEGQYAIERIS